MTLYEDGQVLHASSNISNILNSDFASIANVIGMEEPIIDDETAVYRWDISVASKYKGNYIIRENDVSTFDIMPVSQHTVLREISKPNEQKSTGGRLNKKDGLTRYGDSHVKDKTS